MTLLHVGCLHCANHTRANEPDLEQAKEKVIELGWVELGSLVWQCPSCTKVRTAIARDYGRGAPKDYWAALEEVVRLREMLEIIADPTKTRFATDAGFIARRALGQEERISSDGQTNR